MCMCVRACVCVRAYQFGQAPLAEDPARAGQVVVSADPAPHVEPLSGAPWGGAVLPVEQNQLLLGPHRTALQHTLQLGGHGAGQSNAHSSWREYPSVRATCSLTGRTANQDHIQANFGNSQPEAGAFKQQRIYSPVAPESRCTSAPPHCSPRPRRAPAPPGPPSGCSRPGGCSAGSRG